MDKPGRRKKRKVPWVKIIGIAVLVLVASGASYAYYQDYVYAPPPVYAAIGTSLGTIDVELFPACAPQTVSNFVSLAQSGFYNNLVWHRIVNNNADPEFVVQTGDPNTRNGVNSTRYNWGKGGSSHTVPLEWCGWLHNYAGYLGMARGNDPNSGSSQFYINLSNGTANLSLDPNYTVFGKVVYGMGVACQIARVPVYGADATQLDPQTGQRVSITGQPITPVFLQNVTILSSPPATTGVPLFSCK